MSQTTCSNMCVDKDPRLRSNNNLITLTGYVCGREAFDALENGTPAGFAVNPEHKHHSPLRDAKELVSDMIRVFQQRGVISHHEYAADVPASLQGGPRTEQVRGNCSVHVDVHSYNSLTIHSIMQESRDILERLRRMDNFESQDFDAVVRMPVTSSCKQLKLCWRTLMCMRHTVPVAGQRCRAGNQDEQAAAGLCGGRELALGHCM